MNKTIHIISFDIPFPANYGGVIDVFHKIRCLKAEGINVILHCFEYGNRKPSIELEKLCKSVYYYKRNMSIINHFSILPFNVKSRINSELKKRLLLDNYPIIFEVLHSCYLLNDIDLKYRIKLYRHSNIEHEYFLELAKAESSIIKKIYLHLESFKLKRFESIIINANFILSVSKTDLLYFNKTYPQTPSIYLPSFHSHDSISIKKGKGDYILYHGNLSISENYVAAHWLIDNVFSKISYPVIIAGLNPPKHLIEKIKLHQNIQVQKNCDEQQMQILIENAQIHCLYTHQTTGLKLKLINVLYSGRHIIVNANMLEGTDLSNACEICDTSTSYITEINNLYQKEITSDFINNRELHLRSMSNSSKTKELLNLLKI